MSSLYKMVLAVLLVASATTATLKDEECFEPAKPLAATELKMLFGTWVLVQAYTNPQYYHEKMHITISSHIEFIPSVDNRTLIYNQAHKWIHKCFSKTMTLYVNGKTLQAFWEKDDIITINYYMTSPECLVLRWSSKEGVSLFIYGRGGKVPEADLQTFKTHAECLGFNRPQFTYDGKSEFCPFNSIPPPNAEECSNLMTSESIPELSKLNGTWVLVKSYTNPQYYLEKMHISTSSNIEFILSADNRTFHFHQAHMWNKKCFARTRTLYVTDNYLQAFWGKDDILTVNYYMPSPDVLVLRLSSMEGVSVFIYGRGGKVPEADLQTFKTHAECLGFNRPQFTYDGKSEFCPFNSIPPPNAEECSNLMTSESIPELSKLNGTWVLVKSYTNPQYYLEKMHISTSSNIEFILSADNRTFHFHQAHMWNKKCFARTRTLYVTDNYLQAFWGKDDILTVNYYMPSPDVLVLRLSSMEGVSVFIYGRGGKVPEADLQTFKTHAECLGFNRPQFTYDGKSELCPFNSTQPPSAEECSKVMTPESIPELSKLNGTWVLVKSYTNPQYYLEKMHISTSSNIEFILSADNRTFHFHQAHMWNKKCFARTRTLYVTDNYLQAFWGKDDILTVNYYMPSPDVLVLRLSSMEGVSVFIYGRGGKVPEADLQTFKTHAECLGFNRPQFTYDGKSELCPFNSTQPPSAEECSKVMTPESIPELSKIYGTWVLVKSYTNPQYYIEKMHITTSSNIEFIPSADNRALTYNQAHMRNNKCFSTTRTLHLSDNTLPTFWENDGIITVNYHMPCPECLVLRMSSKDGESLFIYGRTGSVPETALDNFNKQADCLKFTNPQFTYNGVTEQCPFKT